MAGGRLAPEQQQVKRQVRPLADYSRVNRIYVSPHIGSRRSKTCGRMWRNWSIPYGPILAIGPISRRLDFNQEDRTSLKILPRDWVRKSVVVLNDLSPGYRIWKTPATREVKNPRGIYRCKKRSQNGIAACNQGRNLGDVHLAFLTRSTSESALNERMWAYNNHDGNWWWLTTNPAAGEICIYIISRSALGS